MTDKPDASVESFAKYVIEEAALSVRVENFALRGVSDE